MMIVTITPTYSANSFIPTESAFAKTLDTSKNVNYRARGIQAFKSGYYLEAIRYLKSALKRDSKNPKIIFNLASAYYKAAQFDKAYKYFAKLTRYTSYKPIAYYQLGLSSIKLKRFVKAEKWFEKCVETTSIPKLKNLAELALKRIDDSEEAQQEKYQKKKWRVSLSVAAGHDNNVSLSNLELDTVTQKKDNFVNVTGGASGHIVGDIKNGVYSLLSYSNRTYNKESDRDYSVVKAHVAYDLRVGKRYNRFFSQFEQIDLGEEDFQSVYTVGILSQYLGKNKRWLKFHYQISQYNADSDRYSYLDGEQQLLFVEVRKKTSDANYRIKYQAEINNRDDLRVNNQYFDASPFRQTFSTRIWFVNLENWDLSAELSYRKSSYDDQNEFLDGSSKQRSDERAAVGLASKIKISKHWILRASYQYTENHSNIPAYSYDRNISMIGVSYQY